jgi:predicted small lipoprotein YifL
MIVGVVALVCLTGCGFDGPIAFRAPQCANVRGDIESTADEVLMAVTADACHSVDGRLLLEDQSFDILGRAVWQIPGPPVDLIAITLDRSANRPDGDQARELVFMNRQATQRWGVHPVIPAAQAQRDSVGLAWGAGLLLAVVVALVLCVALFVALVGCLRRGEIVLIWFLR